MKKKKWFFIVSYYIDVIYSCLAAPITDAMQGGLLSINNFFTGQYAPYSKAIDFSLFIPVHSSIHDGRKVRVQMKNKDR